MICTDKDCGTETTLRLCEEHLAELIDLLDGVDFLIVNLDPNIQAGKVTKKPYGSEGGNGTRSAESKPPMRIDTNQIRYWLWEIKDTNAYVEARDNKHAGRTLHMARIWVGKARDAVYGPEEDRIDYEANRTKVEEIPPLMPTRKFIPWLRKHARLSITSQIIRHYAHKGYLSPAEREPHPTYHPHVVSDAYNPT